ncbi:hypothetical protein [Flavobacterium sp.]|uniref:hypothetical protein n=1 Tax=Flavobacterium sp. TaxID=239 RepID=UPI002B5FABAD|nr:hypothetical protein [Flavobacterium sp.]HSD07914.1 hypothetical protein [Flavobacterium sp.]
MSEKKKTIPVVEQTVGVNTENTTQIASETAVVNPDVIAPYASETPVVNQEVVVAHTHPLSQTEKNETISHESLEAELIPSGRFIAENGTEYEFAVSQFTFQGKVYTKEEALSNHADVLEHLASVKSFILKKV